MLPHSDLPAGLLDGPLTERNDEAAFLGQGDELHRRNDAAAGVEPAHERLDTGEAAGSEVDRGLVVEDELGFLDARPQLRFDFDSADRVGVHVRVEDGKAPFVGPGNVHRQGAVAEQVLGCGPAGDSHGYADIGLEFHRRAG